MKGLINRMRDLFSRQSVSAVEDSPSIMFCARNVTKGNVIAQRVRWAGTSTERRRGLLDHESLDVNEGMYIVPTQWIHMFGMRFSIDVAFIASDGRVLHIERALQPNRFSRLVLRAEGALEFAAGVLASSNTTVGDTIELVESSN